MCALQTSRRRSRLYNLELVFDGVYLGACPGPTHAGKNTDFCGNNMKPTLCDPRLRTFGKVGGKWPECGSAEDRQTKRREQGSTGA